MTDRERINQAERQALAATRKPSPLAEALLGARQVQAADEQHNAKDDEENKP